MVVGLGIDVASVERVARALQRHGDRFSARVLTQAERADLAARAGDRATALAGRFAAKEAAFKEPWMVRIMLSACSRWLAMNPAR